jgi:hypothetical protein
MDWFNLFIVALYIFLARYSDNVTSHILAFNILTQISFDIVFVHFGMYRIADPSWFFVIKGIILVLAIGMLFIRNGNFGVAFLLFLNLLYLSGMWHEVVFTTISRPLHSFYTGSMLIIMALELWYMFRVSRVYDRVRNFYRRVINRRINSTSYRYVNKHEQAQL